MNKSQCGKLKGNCYSKAQAILLNWAHVADREDENPSAEKSLHTRNRVGCVNVWASFRCG